MYSLREVVNTHRESKADFAQVISNSFLGKRYIYIHKDTNKEEFIKTFRICFDREYEAGSDRPIKPDDVSITCRAFIYDENGIYIPLYSGVEYYIMMPNGATFEHLYL